MFNLLARFVVKMRWPIILFWIAAVPITYFTLPSLSSVTNSSNSAFLPSNSPSQRAQYLAEPIQGKGTANTAYIVAHRTDGKINLQDDVVIGKIEAQVKALPSVVNVADQSISKDGQVRLISIGFKSASYGPAGTQIVDSIRNMFSQYSYDNGLNLHMGGDLASTADSDSVTNASKNNTQLWSVVFIVIILIIVYRSLLASFVTLLPPLFALLIASPIIAESTKIGVDVSPTTELLLVVLLLGAGTDYGLFLVFRFKEELAKGHNSKQAVIEALTKVGQSVTFSALTVISALLCLLVAKFGFYKGLGPSLAIGVAITLLASLTLLPALLTFFGKKLFWPVKVRIDRQQKLGLWGKFASFVIKTPYVTLLVGFVIFSSLIYGTKGWKTGGLTNGGPPSTSDSYIASQIVNEHFPSSVSDPQLLVMHFDKSQWNSLSNISTAQSSLQNSNVFSNLIGPIDLTHPSISELQISKLYKLLGAPSDLPLKQPSSIKLPNDIYLQYRSLSQFISADGKTIEFFASIKGVTQGSNQASSKIPAVRDALINAGTAAGASETGVDSASSFTYDINHLSNQDLKKIIPIVLALIAILLAILLRSLIAPIYLVITVGLTYLASMGFANIVFNHLSPNSSGINFVLPFLLFVFSMALGEDYNILVMSRIREESTKDVSLRQAITKAISVTGTTVTSAGLILAGTFIVLSVVGGSTEVQQIGFSIAFGILLDTFFVRTLLVPSIAVLLGRWNWWPSKLSRKK